MYGLPRRRSGVGMAARACLGHTGVFNFAACAFLGAAGAFEVVAPCLPRNRKGVRNGCSRLRRSLTLLCATCFVHGHAWVHITCICINIREVPCRAVPCRALSFRAVPLFHVPCFEIPCRATNSRAVPWDSMPCQNIPCRALGFRAMPEIPVPCRALGLRFPILG